MKKIKQKVVAILLALFQIVTIASPVNTAIAAPEAPVEGGYNLAYNAYIIPVQSNETALSRLANDHYYMIVQMSTDETLYAIAPFSEISENVAFVSFSEFYREDGSHLPASNTGTYSWTIAQFDNEPSYSQLESIFNSGQNNNGRGNLSNGVYVNVDRGPKPHFSAKVRTNTITVRT